MIVIQNIPTTPMYGVRELPLSQRKGSKLISLVDPWVYPELMRYRWTAMWNGKGIYALRTHSVSGEGKRGQLYLHRFLTGCPSGMVVDHINGKTLDNRSRNLRVCTSDENKRNIKKNRGKSKYKGVTFDVRDIVKNAKWTAGITSGGKNHFLGSYFSEEEAAMAYDAAARILHGEFASLNLPDRYLSVESISDIQDMAKNRRRLRLGGRNKFGGQGINFQPRGSGFRAIITTNGKRKHLGTYRTPEEAHTAYRKELERIG